MELSIYEIIKRAIITEKSLELFNTYGKVTFEVENAANKIMIRNAIEKIWSVKVEKVAIINRKDKNKIFARRPFTASGHKKAIVTLKKGYKIDLSGQFETMGVAKQDAAQ